jgi:hypothetical protein
MNNLFYRLFAPKLDIEVISAYLHKLPKEIRVSWFRDEGFIIGKIFIGPSEQDYVMTQALTPKEFFRMVNEAVYIAMDFNPEYIEFFHQQNDAYVPTDEAWHALSDSRIARQDVEIVNRIEERRLAVA